MKRRNEANSNERMLAAVNQWMEQEEEDVRARLWLRAKEAQMSTINHSFQVTRGRRPVLMTERKTLWNEVIEGIRERRSQVRFEDD